MRKKYFCILLIISLTLPSCGKIDDTPEGVLASEEESEYEVTMKRDILCLMMAYPEYIKDVNSKADGKVYVVLKSGKRILYDDKRKKSSEEKLNSPDIQDMMEQVYPLGKVTSLMEDNFDPGRVRVYALLSEVYGSSRQNIEHNLVGVRVGRTFSFNKCNGASRALTNVMKELGPVTSSHRNINSFIYPASGTYNYRTISGTSRLSPHAYGIAIDLASNKNDYWKWATREQGQKRLLSYPQNLVEVFEKNGFVWGGKWGHFDILHFEYRPEIIMKAKCFGSRPVSGVNWFEGAEGDEKRIADFIKIIEDAIK